MTVGERIKKIRIFRKMTMDEFGAALGFEGKSMSVRIAQYETGARVPKANMLAKIADVLQCNYKALDDYGCKATFFVVGDFLEKYPDRVKEMYKKGYTESDIAQNLGIHPYRIKLALNKAREYS